MKKFGGILFFLTTAVLAGCYKDEVDVLFPADNNPSFVGTFRTSDSDDISGTVTLEILNGSYHCTTSLPYGHGAGKLEVNGSTINFIDTLFFPVPTVYGPSYVLSGEHQFKFDGNNLEIWREKNVGYIEYKLELVK